MQSDHQKAFVRVLVAIYEAHYKVFPNVDYMSAVASINLLVSALAERDAQIKQLQEDLKEVKADLIEAITYREHLIEAITYREHDL